MTEIELKFVLDEDGMRRLTSRVQALFPDAAAARSRNLRSVYFDTADCRLKRAGIALRLRRDGRRWIQTVKADASIQGGLQRAREVEIPAPGGKLALAAIPEDDLRLRLAELTAGEALSPVCETQMTRIAQLLPLANGGCAELALDAGEIVAGARRAPFREAELELVEGAAEDLFALAARLMREDGMRLSRLPKSARGYLLAETGRIEPAPEPRNACRVPIRPEMTAEIAARDILRECFAQVSANVAAVLETEAPEGPHQLRVGLRRLRSAIGLFRPVIGHPETLRLGAEARRLGAEVGALRDLDVLIADLIAPAEAQHPEEAGFAALRAAIEARRETVRAQLRGQLRGGATQAFLFDLTRFIETRGWLSPGDFGQTARLAMPVGDLSLRALDKRWKSVRKHARNIDRLDVGQRHELRKELKKLRYAIEFMSPLYPPKEVGSFVKTLKRLQDVFGELNDLAMAEEMLCRPGSPGAGDPEAQRAVGRLLGAHALQAEAAWSHARELWQGVTAAGPFWR